MLAHEIAGDIFESTPNEPHILFVGEGFDLTDASNLRVLSLKWNLVITSSRDEGLLHALNNLRGYRTVREIYTEYSKQSDVIKPNSRDLKLIRLFTDDAATRQRSKQTAAFMHVSNICDRTLKITGRFIVVGYSSEDSFSNDSMQNLLLTFARRKFEAVFYGVDAALHNALLEIENTIQSELDFDDVMCFFSERLGELIPQKDEDDSSDDVTLPISSHNESKLKVYISRKTRYIDASDVRKLRAFATLLNESDVNREEIEPQHAVAYFSTFLKSSAIKPIWYGYKEKFNLVRDYETELMEKVRKGLSSPGVESELNTPICLRGESGSGKSVALAHLAYRVFNEKEYPVIYLNKSISDFWGNDSDNLETLHDVLLLFKNDEAQNRKHCTLIVWDNSMFESDVEQFLAIYRRLKNIWFRNVQFVVSAAYKSFGRNADGSDYSDFQFVDTPMKLSSAIKEGNERSEMDRLKTILKKRAKWSAEEIDEKLRLDSESDEHLNSFMIMLHYLFYETRKTIEDGMRASVRGALLDALNKNNVPPDYPVITAMARALENAYKAAGYDPNLESKTNDIVGKGYAAGGGASVNKIERLIQVVAICKVCGTTVPLELAMRMVGINEFESFRKVIDTLPFIELEYDEVDSGTHTILFRTRYEASMYLNAQTFDRSGIIEAIVGMIKEMKVFNDYEYEMRIALNILSRIGPNSRESFGIDFRLRLDEYPKIFEALKERRKDSTVEPSLAVQESTYIREYHSRSNPSDHDYELSVPRFNEAIDLCVLAIEIERKSPQPNLATIRQLIVEKAVSKNRLLALPSGQLSLHEFQMFVDDLDYAIRISRTASDASYGINAKLKMMTYAYDKLPEIEKSNIEASGYHFVEMIENEYADTAQNEEVQHSISSLLDKINSAMNDEYIESLIEGNKPNGYCLKARKAMRDIGISRTIGDSIIDMNIANRCGEIYHDVFEEAPDSTVFANDIKCQWLILRLKWIAYNRRDIFSKNEQTTALTEEQWREILHICSAHDKCEAETLNFFYFKSLAYLHLIGLENDGSENDNSRRNDDNYLNQFWKTIKTIRDRTESLTFTSSNRSRVRHMVCKVRHMECKSDRTPIIAKGKFSNSLPEGCNVGRFVEIPKLKGKSFDESLIYFRINNIAQKDRENVQSGRPHDFNLGLSYMGLSAYTGFRSKDGDSNED